MNAIKILKYLFYGAIGGAVWGLVDDHRYGLAAGLFTAAILIILEKNDD